MTVLALWMKRRRNAYVAWALWLFLAPLGAHRWYLRDRMVAAILVAATATYTALWVYAPGDGWYLTLTMVLMWAVEGVLLPGRIQTVNQRIMADCWTDATPVTSPAPGYRVRGVRYYVTPAPPAADDPWTTS